MSDSRIGVNQGEANQSHGYSVTDTACGTSWLKQSETDPTSRIKETSACFVFSLICHGQVWGGDGRSPS